MRGWTARTVVLGAALFLAPAAPAFAQSFGAGATSLGDDRGPGVAVDYSRPFWTLFGQRVGWVVDIGVNRLEVSNVLFDGSVDTRMFQGGVRMGGSLLSKLKLTWHGQLLVGAARAVPRGKAANFCGDLKDVVGDEVACGGRGSDVVVSPGIGVDYQLMGFLSRLSLRARVEAPVINGHATSRSWVGLALQLP